jgi:tetratricopeptide (TPR) repeat protein
MGLAQASMEDLSKYDFSLFNQAAAYYREGRFLDAISTLNKFKSETGIQDLTILPFKQAYFEVICSFHAIGVQKSEALLKQCAAATKKVKASYDMTSEIEINLSTILGEVYYALREYDKAVENYKKVYALSNGAVQPELLFKYFAAKIESQELSEIEDLEDELVKYPQFSIPMNIAWLDFAIKAENREMSESKAKWLLSNYDQLETDDKLKLIHAFVSDLSNPNIILDKAIEFRNEVENINAVTLLALAYFKLEQYDDAIGTLLSDESYSSYATSTNLMAKAYERKKDYANAWNYYEQSGQLQRQMFEESPSNYIDPVDYIEKYADIDWSVLKLKLATEKVYQQESISPIFMVGFPRSGTTLLDTIFKTNKNIVVLSEHPFMNVLIKHMEDKFDKKYPQQLLELTDDELVEMREIYESMVARKAQIQVELNQATTYLATAEIVDKNPLNTEHLPLINLLYPHARVIVSLRHPLDTVLSCLQQNFKAIGQYTSIEQCVEKYQDVMSFYLQLKKQVNTNYFELKYEDLVGDFAGQMEKLSKYLKFKLDKDADQKFSEVAQSRVINTSSRDQVTKGLFKTSLAKWKNYEQYLLPYESRLSRVISSFDYELN